MCAGAIAPRRGVSAEPVDWQMAPYRVLAYVAFAEPQCWPATMRAEVGERLMQRVAFDVGPVLSLEVQPPPPSFRSRMLAPLENITAIDKTLISDPWDKLLLIRVEREGSEHRVAAREWDRTVDRLSKVQVVPVRQPSRLHDAIFTAATGALSPLARIRRSDRSAAVLEVRGSAIPAPRGQSWIGREDIYLPLIRRRPLYDRDADGADAATTEVIPWTFLRATGHKANLVQCDILSGLRNPLAVSSWGNITRYALRIRPHNTPTTLQLRGRGTQRALFGYEVYEDAPADGNDTLLGTADINGRLVVEPADDPLRMLRISFGGLPQARIPLVAGWHDQVTVTVRDDIERLQLQGELLGLHDRLIDLVAQREVLAARTRRHIRRNDIKGAKVLLEQLRAQGAGRQLLRDLDRLEERMNQSDRSTIAALSPQIADTRALFDKRLRPYLASQLSDAIRDAEN